MALKPLGWEAIVLAAGASRRMKRTKALLPWQGRTLVEHQIRELLATRVSRVVLVLGAHAGAIRRRLDLEALESEAGKRFGGSSSLQIVANGGWEKGKCGSIRLGAESISQSASHIAVVAVDQPTTAEVLETLFAGHEMNGSEITIPTHRGLRGHPIVVRATQLESLKELQEETEGLRGLVERVESEGSLGLVDMSAPSLLWNLNRPRDLMLGEGPERTGRT